MTMTSFHLLFCLFIFFSSIHSVSSLVTLDEFLDSGKEYLQTLRQVLEPAIKSTSDDIYHIETNDCGIIENYCELPSDVEDSLQVNPQFGNVKVSDENFVTILPDNMTTFHMFSWEQVEPVKDIMCATRALMKDFKNNFVDPAFEYTWQYFADYQYGSLNIFPATKYTPCPIDYDPRLQSWFASTVSGPKNVVILFDNHQYLPSVSVDPERINRASAAILTVLKTLSFEDYLQIVTFNTDPSLPDSMDAQLYQVTEPHITTWSNFVDEIFPSIESDTNLSGALKLAGEILNSSIPFTPNCNQVILVISDGENTNTELDPIQAVENYKMYENVVNPRIFTYSLSSPGAPVLKKISCQTGGIWYPLYNDITGLVKKIAQYYSVFAFGLDPVYQTQDRWSEPYIDTLSDPSVGTILTRSTPIFDTTVEPAKFLGVLATDMKLGVIIDATNSSETQIREAVYNRSTCPKIKISESTLNILRGSQGTCEEMEVWIIVLIVLAVLAVVIGLIVFSCQSPDKFEKYLKNTGYIILIPNLIGNLAALGYSWLKITQHSMDTKYNYLKSTALSWFMIIGPSLSFFIFIIYIPPPLIGLRFTLCFIVAVNVLFGYYFILKELSYPKGPSFETIFISFIDLFFVPLNLIFCFPFWKSLVTQSFSTSQIQIFVKVSLFRFLFRSCT